MHKFISNYKFINVSKAFFKFFLKLIYVRKCVKLISLYCTLKSFSFNTKFCACLARLARLQISISFFFRSFKLSSFTCSLISMRKYKLLCHFFVFKYFFVFNYWIFEKHFFVLMKSWIGLNNTINLCIFLPWLNQQVQAKNTDIKCIVFYFF